MRHSYVLVSTVSECTKIAHRRSLAIFTADEGIAENSAARTIFTHSLRRRNRGSLAIFVAEEIAHLGALKSRAIFGGAVKIRSRSHRESRDFGALSIVSTWEVLSVNGSGFYASGLIGCLDSHIGRITRPVSYSSHFSFLLWFPYGAPDRPSLTNLRDWENQQGKSAINLSNLGKFCQIWPRAIYLC